MLAAPPVGVKVVVSVTRIEPRWRAERAADVRLQVSWWRPALVIFMLPVQAVSVRALRAADEPLKVPRWVSVPGPGTMIVDFSTELVAEVGTTVNSAGVTLFEGADAAVCQLFRFARAVNVYALPTVRPVTMQDVVGLVTTHCFEASWVAATV